MFGTTLFFPFEQAFLPPMFENTLFFHIIFSTSCYFAHVSEQVVLLPISENKVFRHLWMITIDFFPHLNTSVGGNVKPVWIRIQTSHKIFINVAWKKLFFHLHFIKVGSGIATISLATFAQFSIHIYLNLLFENKPYIYFFIENCRHIRSV